MLVARRLGQAVYVTAPLSEPQKLYVVVRSGRVRVIANGRLLAKPFLDLRGKVSLRGEEGLLSIAFSPRYADDHLVYACFTAPAEGVDSGGPIKIVEYRVVDGIADPATARTLLSVPHRESPYHNGGQIAFGPDGMLYAGFGDGGYDLARGGPGLFPDPHGNSQNLSVFLGKIVRLDPTSADPHPAVVAYGLRNPWRFSFTPTGDLVIGDVGWNQREEIDVVPRGQTGLVNFGWSVYEGRSPRAGESEVTLNPTGELTWPRYTYRTRSSTNCAVVGGYVYRGAGAPSVRERYVFGDYCSGKLSSMSLADGSPGVRREPVRIAGSKARSFKQLDSFGQDARGVLYAVTETGRVYRIP